MRQVLFLMDFIAYPFFKVTVLPLKRATDSTDIFLEGTIQNEKLLLSSFTGDKIYLLKADLRDSITLGRGSFRINDKELACSAKKVK